MSEKNVLRMSNDKIDLIANSFAANRNDNKELPCLDLAFKETLYIDSVFSSLVKTRNHCRNIAMTTAFLTRLLRSYKIPADKIESREDQMVIPLFHSPSYVGYVVEECFYSLSKTLSVLRNFLETSVAYKGSYDGCFVFDQQAFEEEVYFSKNDKIRQYSQEQKALAPLEKDLITLDYILQTVEDILQKVSLSVRNLYHEQTNTPTMVVERKPLNLSSFKTAANEIQVNALAVYSGITSLLEEVLREGEEFLNSNVAE